MSARDAIVALRRFGLGPRPGEAAAIARDPRGYLLAALDKPHKLTIAAPLPSAVEALHKTHDLRQSIRAARKSAPAGNPGGDKPAEARKRTPPGSPPEVMAPMAMPAPKGPDGTVIRDLYVGEVAARISHAARTDTGYLERLAQFWGNHFCVSARKGPQLRVTAGAYEREAIRPHVLGRFVDMVKASATHPAMLHYLDNAQSIGPGSPAGLRTGKGLNENYARELLELHTLGVGGGYTQADVTSLARILTGWTVAGPHHPDFGRFLFARNAHEPGSHVVLARTYGAGGQEQGMKVIEDLARHPATARYIATRFARYFVSEGPPAKLVEHLARTFRESDGDLKALARALVLSDEAWSEPPRKILSPLDLIVAAYRALLLSPPDPFAIRTLNVLGQPMWEVPAPKGWPDEDNFWAAPKELFERIDWAETMVKQFGGVRELKYLADDIYSGTLSRITLEAIARAPSVADGLVIFLLSPEFQRR